MSTANLQFSSSDPLAELVWTDVWHGFVRAQAQDSISGTDAEEDEILSDNASLDVMAQTALAAAEAKYFVTNGPQVAKGGGDVELITGAGLMIDGITAQADAQAASTGDNFFAITGGMTGDAVGVTFTLDYAYLLNGEADEDGFFDVFVFALLEIQDLADLTADIDDVDDRKSAFVTDQASGTNTLFFKQVNDTLVLNALLEFDKQYFLFMEADSEVFGTNSVPEPAPLYLLTLGLALLGWRMRGRA